MELSLETHRSTDLCRKKKVSRKGKKFELYDGKSRLAGQRNAVRSLPTLSCIPMHVVE